MKKLKKSNAPSELVNYLTDNVNDIWEQFRNNGRDVYDKVKKQLRVDQRGLCAYCEIDLVEGDGRGLDDFRVEHFHPKSPHRPPPNRSLEWNNLLGVCTGGNASGVCLPSRFSSPDHSCDVPKGNHDWTNLILNPLTDIPSFPMLFRFDESTGQIHVDADICPPHLIEKAAESISRLRLNSCARLLRDRRAVIDSLRDQIQEYLNAGLDIDAVMGELAMAHLPEQNHPLPAFFTCVRWYLGPAAERRLVAIAYDG